MANLSKLILDWYDQNHRSLPWRFEASARKKSAHSAQHIYHIWLSEMMLQQTTAKAVIPYYHKFIKRFPSLEKLASADIDEVLELWAGLGYYRRAHYLHRTAKIIVNDKKGVFPQSEKELKTLPGIGDYMAAAISAFAFHQASVIIDGNIKRIIARMFCLPFDDDRMIALKAGQLTPKQRAGDYAQALMDLGAMICRPLNPKCCDCVWRDHCGSWRAHRVQDYGLRKRKTPQTHRTGYGLIIIDKDRGKILLERRDNHTLLSGMMAFPSFGWDSSLRQSQKSAAQKGAAQKGAVQDFWERLFSKKLKWRKLDAPVKHIFTHFKLTLDIYVIELCANKAQKLKIAPNAQWVRFEHIDKKGLPSLMRKIWVSYQKLRVSG